MEEARVGERRRRRSDEGTGTKARRTGMPAIEKDEQDEARHAAESVSDAKKPKRA